MFHSGDTQNLTGLYPGHPALKTCFEQEVGPVTWSSDSIHILCDLKETFLGLRIHLLNLASMISVFIAQKRIKLWWFMERLDFSKYSVWNQRWLSASTSHRALTLNNFTLYICNFEHLWYTNREILEVKSTNKLMAQSPHPPCSNTHFQYI